MINLNQPLFNIQKAIKEKRSYKADKIKNVTSALP